MTIDSVRKTRSIDERVLDQIIEPLEVARLSKHIEESDPSESTASMMDLMAQRGSPPIRGDLQWTQLEALVANGCADYLSDLSSEDREAFTKGILNYISKSVGQGPYQQEIPELQKGLSRLLSTTSKGRSDLPSLLGALLALSFYDTSTARDHSLLRHQIQSIWNETEAELRQSLRSKGWAEWDTDEAWNPISKPFMTRIAAYIDDPLWPMFKYPLSRNEMCRLRNSMRALAMMGFDGSIQRLSKHLGENNPNRRLTDRLQLEINRVLYRLPARVIDLRLRNHGPIGYWLINEKLLLRCHDRFMEVPPQVQVASLFYLYLGHRTDDLTAPKSTENETPIQSKDSLPKMHSDALPGLGHGEAVD
jgi:hypothetical protein